MNSQDALAHEEAEARLRDAAQDLLASLEECVSALSSDAMMNCWEFLYAHNYAWKGPVVDLLKARAAIAKATGEKP